MAVSGAIFSTDMLEYAVSGGRKLVQGLTVDFPAGAISALIGHNGSGKSTFLKMLARQILPTSGKDTFGGKPLAAIGSRDYARHVAYLPQDLSAAHDMSVRELVACGRYPWHGALGRFTAVDKAKVDEALDMTHTEQLADRAVGTLSGGERQRAWIGMLLAQDSKCLLLDEPTSALDLAHQVEVLTLVRRLCDEKGLSVIVVLHDINMAARYADRLFALKAGRLVAEGTPSDLLDRHILADIYGIAMEIVTPPGLGLPLAYVR